MAEAYRKYSADKHGEWGGDDCALSALIRIADFLCDHAGARFTSCGFGRTIAGGNATNGTELCCALEALPEILKWLYQPSYPTCQLDFFEQGVELFITISAVNETELDLEGRTMLEGPLDPVHERISRLKFQAMMNDLYRTFIQAVEACCPQELTNPWLLDEWINGCMPYAGAVQRASL